MSQRVSVTVNGALLEADVWGGESLLTMLRDTLELPGSKNACEQGECGSCSVVLDGELVCACLVLAAQVDGHEVVTVEGLARGDDLHPVQAAFVEAGAVQCGFCTPGLVVAVADLLERVPDPSEDEVREALSGQRLPLHRLREDLRRRAPRRGAPVSVTAHRTTLRVGKVGERLLRDDAIPKVRGDFAYSSDLSAPGMLWGDTLRSPHPHARIVSIDISAALAQPGVHAVLTHADVPGRKTYGLEFPDQPVLAIDRVRYVGEPVAIVAAEHPEQARLAIEAIVVEYELLEPVVDMERALEQEPLHPDRPTMGHGYRDDPRPNVVRHMVIRHGDPDTAGDVVVEGVYELGIQDQAFLGPESGLAVPDGEGGVDIHVATQWLHVDRDQVAPCLGLPLEQVRIHLAGVGGAFGGREDLSMQIHGAMLALHANRPGEDGLRPRRVVHGPRPPAPGADLVRAPRDPRRAVSPASGCGSCSTAARTPRARRRSRRTRPRSRSARTGSTTRSSSRRRSTRTTRRAARCAASARCRRASPRRRRWTCSRPSSRSTPSSCAS